MKKNNLILGAFLAFTAILFSGCGGGASSSDSPSTEKVEGSTESTESGGGAFSSDSPSTEKVEGSTESTESGGMVTIGTQVWTSKNLDVATYRNGDVIPQVQDYNDWKNLTTGAWCYYENESAYGRKYGKLYNWYAVNDPRGLAPNGYHIPTDEEWTKLTEYLGGDREAGTKMKSASGWIFDGNGTNVSGFSGLPGGSRYLNGTFDGIDDYGAWWSSDSNTGGAWDRDLDYSDGRVARLNANKKNGLFVRCVSTSTEKVEGSNESTESGGVVTIGTQVWTSKNLDVATYRNGDVIPQVQDYNDWKNLTTGAWCYYENESAYGRKYGKLYNWYAVNDPRGLAPNGYHIPTDEEWTKLTEYLGGDSEAGTKMKSTSGWYENRNGTNSSGFSGLPGGYRSSGGTFTLIDYYGYWWSSSENITYNAWPRSLSYSKSRQFPYGNVNRSNFDKGSGFSVRCLRD